MTLEELKKAYAEKGATTRREETTEQGTQYYDDPVQLGGGWTAWENQPQMIGYEGQGMDATPIYGEIDPAQKLGGFQRSEGNKNYFYDTAGNLVHVEKQTTDWDTLGPIIMAAASGYLGGIPLGETGLTAGNVLSGARAIQNKDLMGLLSSGAGALDTSGVDLGGLNVKDAMKYAGLAKGALSGTDAGLFKALTGLASDKNLNLTSSLAGFEANPDDFIEGYFQPGGEGYLDAGNQDMTVREDPGNLDALLRELSPYAVDGGPSVFTQQEDIPEFETVSNRPMTSLDTILGNPDIMQTVQQDIDEQPEMVITDKRDDAYVPSIRTKEITSDIPDFISPDQIDTLFPNLNINDILQTVTPAVSKTTTPAKPATKKVPTKTNAQQSLSNLGLNAQNYSQDPFADIKLMEEVFGPDIAYKLRALGSGDATKKTAASRNVEALTKLLRG